MQKKLLTGWLGLHTALAVTAALLATSVAEDPRCPAKDPEGEAILIPNPFNCSTYYMCDHGCAILKECPGDLYFNPELLVCDFAFNVTCEADRIKPVAFSCPTTAHYPVYYPDAFSCTGFYLCDRPNVVGEYFKCPSTLYFNPKTSTCDYPENVECKAKR